MDEAIVRVESRERWFRYVEVMVLTILVAVNGLVAGFNYVVTQELRDEQQTMFEVLRRLEALERNAASTQARVEALAGEGTEIAEQARLENERSHEVLSMFIRCLARAHGRGYRAFRRCTQGLRFETAARAPTRSPSPAPSPSPSPIPSPTSSPRPPSPSPSPSPSPILCITDICVT